MIIDIVELKKDLAESVKRICREVDCVVSVQDEMKENVDVNGNKHAQRVSEGSELSDE
jgi:hypothetical protein